MGLFGFGRKGSVSGAAVKGGPKRNASLVLVNPGSRVYHCENGGCSLVASDAQEMTEKKALASGLYRCKKCDWYYFDRGNGNG